MLCAASGVGGIVSVCRKEEKVLVWLRKTGKVSLLASLPLYWDSAPGFAGAWRQRCAGKDLDIVAISADTPLLIVCRDRRVPGHARSSCIIFPDCRQISSRLKELFTRFHLLLVFITHQKSFLSPAGLLVLPRAAGCASAKVGSGMESGWG